MIVEGLLSLISSFLSFILNLLPNIPGIPDRITSVIDNFMNIIFSNCGLLGVFVSLDLVKILIPLVLIVVNFEYIYKIILWVIKKIPFLNME